MEIRASLFEQRKTGGQYYFGRPLYCFQNTEYWIPAIPGKLLINDSKLIFKAKFPNAFIKNTLFIPNQQIIPIGEVEVALDLRQSRKIRKKTRIFHVKRIIIDLKPHGEFLKDYVKYLVFIILDPKKEVINEIYETILKAKNKSEGNIEAGWIKLIETKDLSFE